MVAHISDCVPSCHSGSHAGGLGRMEWHVAMSAHLATASCTCCIPHTDASCSSHDAMHVCPCSVARSECGLYSMVTLWQGPSQHCTWHMPYGPGCKRRPIKRMRFCLEQCAYALQLLALPAPRTSHPAAARATRSAALRVTPCCSPHVVPCCPARRALLQPAHRALLPCASRPAAASVSRPTAASASRPAALRAAPCCSQRVAPYYSQRVALCCPARRALLQPARRALLQPARRALLPCTACTGATTAAAAARATAVAGAGGAGPSTDRHCLSWPLSRQLQRLGVDSGGHCLSRMTPPLSSFASGFFSEPVQVVEALVFYVLHRGGSRAAALGASESAAALGASESAAALGARASPTTAVPSGSLSSLHLPTFSTNLVSNAAIQDVGVDTSIPGGQRVAICTLSSGTTDSLTPPYRVSAVCTPVSLSLGFPGPCPPSRARLPHCAFPASRGGTAPLLTPEFPPTTAPPQTLHMNIWGPAPVGGTEQERYFLLVVDDCTRYTTVFPLRRMADVSGVLIPGIHEGIVQSFTLPASPQQNGIAERRIGLIMEVARTSMIHAAAPHFLWPFAIRYAAHQLNLWPRFFEPEASPTLRWTGKFGDTSVFRVRGALFIFRDGKASKLSSRTLRCVFLGFPIDAPPWVLLPQLRGITPPLMTQRPLAALHAWRPPRGFPPRPSSPPPQPAGVDFGAETTGAKPGGVEIEGAGSGGAATGGAGSGGAGSWGAATGGDDSGGNAGAGGTGGTAGGARGAASAGGTSGAAGAGGAGATSPRGTAGAGGATSAGGARAGGTEGAGAAGPGGARTGGAGAAGAGGAFCAGGATGAAGSGGTGGNAGGGHAGAGGTGGAGADGPGGARTRGAGAAGASSAADAGGAGGATCESTTAYARYACLPLLYYAISSTGFMCMHELLAFLG
ncbi:unnamed protein product [Closterium sp. NIES-54]